MNLPEKFKTKKGLEILGIKKKLNDDTREYLLGIISDYIFEQSNRPSGKKTFDVELDYEYYFPDFLKYNVNLNKNDIPWWEFNSILGAIFLDENSNLSKVLDFRSYQKPSKNTKSSENELHLFRMKMKKLYSLPNECGSLEDTENNIRLLMQRIEDKNKERR
jgi:hypothetical protein